MFAQNFSKARGFTLTELAVTLLIAAMVSAMALPSLANLTRKNA